MSLDTQTKKASLVLNFPPLLDCKKIINNLECYLKNSCLEYYYILHDKDTKEDGSLKTKHLHVVILLDKKTRLLTILNRFSHNVYESELYNNLISIESVKDYDLAIAYLIHKNDLNKYQYSINEVKTNNYEYLQGVINTQQGKELSIDYLIELCETYDNVLDVLRIVGLWNSKTYLNVITYIFNKTHKLPF